jgi:hypothetical protein
MQQLAAQSMQSYQHPTWQRMSANADDKATPQELEGLCALEATYLSSSTLTPQVQVRMDVCTCDTHLQGLAGIFIHPAQLLHVGPRLHLLPGMQ